MKKNKAIIIIDELNEVYLAVYDEVTKEYSYFLIEEVTSEPYEKIKKISKEFLVDLKVREEKIK